MPISYSGIKKLANFSLLRRRHYWKRPLPSISASLPPDQVPHVTCLRPIKGIEPNLYECLACTFQQQYPRDKLTIYFCISSKSDPAYPILERLLADFPGFDVRILVEEEDPELQGEGARRLGPNPKIRNMSRGYREAKGDLIWIMDCNVWVGKGVCGRMVDAISGLSPNGPTKKYKFVHHLPVAVDVDKASLEYGGSPDERKSLLNSTPTSEHNPASFSSTSLSSPSGPFGGRLDEMFLSSSHAKMYTAINTVLIAPCIVGKSNMFRRSHLIYLTSEPASGSTTPTPGIDFFSSNICEDHLIGDLLWRKKVPAEKGSQAEKYGKHALVFGDLAFQPVANMSVSTYMARRVRWLRVRKFTVLLATLVEPGTESFLCSAYGAFAFVTLIVPRLFPGQQLPLPKWILFILFWLLSVTLWCLIDRTQYVFLHSGATVEVDSDTPDFARPSSPASRSRARSFSEFVLAWLGREALAGIIWVRAFWGGTGVVWRERRFWVGVDMRVHEVGAEGVGLRQFFGLGGGDEGKARRD